MCLVNNPQTVKDLRDLADKIEQLTNGGKIDYSKGDEYTEAIFAIEPTLRRVMISLLGVSHLRELILLPKGNVAFGEELPSATFDGIDYDAFANSTILIDEEEFQQSIEEGILHYSKFVPS